MIQTAFQIGAFQFNAFQEGLQVGAGGWRYAWLAQQAARRRRRRQVEPVPLHPTLEEVRELVAEAAATARLSFRTRPIVTDLGPLAEAMTARANRIELEEFKALLADLAEIDEYA